MSTLEQTILCEIESLTDEQKQSVLSFVRFLKFNAQERDLLKQQTEIRLYRGKLKWEGNLDETK